MSAAGRRPPPPASARAGLWAEALEAKLRGNGRLPIPRLGGGRPVWARPRCLVDPAAVRAARRDGATIGALARRFVVSCGYLKQIASEIEADDDEAAGPSRSASSRAGGDGMPRPLVSEAALARLGACPRSGTGGGRRYDRPSGGDLTRGGS